MQSAECRAHSAAHSAFCILHLKIRRHAPLVVSRASQTLLSSRTRTRQGENLLFAQSRFARQSVERGQEPVHFGLLGEKTVVKPRGLLVRELTDLFDYLARSHTRNLSVPAPEASRHDHLHRHQRHRSGAVVLPRGSQPLNKHQAPNTNPQRSCKFQAQRGQEEAAFCSRPQSLTGPSESGTGRTSRHQCPVAQGTKCHSFCKPPIL